MIDTTTTNPRTITTTITVDGVWGSSSSAATYDDPTHGHTGEYGDAVYAALETAWDALEDGDDDTVTVQVGGAGYTLERAE